MQSRITTAFDRVRSWARRLKRDVLTLWLAARHPDTPVTPKLLAAAVAAYGLSPIDLIPDFIPVLGYVDDLLLLPLGIWLVIRLMPPVLLTHLRARALTLAERPTSRWMSGVIIVIWLIGTGLIILWARAALSSPG